MKISTIPKVGKTLFSKYVTVLNVNSEAQSPEILLNTINLILCQVMPEVDGNSNRHMIGINR